MLGVARGLDEVPKVELCVCQINRFHRAEDRAVLITDRHLYKMDPLKQYKPMKTLPLYNVGSFICFIGFYLQTQAGKPKTSI